jgi:hypothetical protein
MFLSPLPVFSSHGNDDPFVSECQEKFLHLHEKQMTGEINWNRDAKKIIKLKEAIDSGKKFNFMKFGFLFRPIAGGFIK